MSGLKRLWSRIAGIVDLLEHMGDPTGDYLFSLEKRIARLERHLERLAGQSRLRPGGGGTQQQTMAQTRSPAP